MIGSDKLSDMKNFAKELIAERNWEQFHTPKNIAMSLVREASETLEHFIWAENDTIKNEPERIVKIKDEMGDVLLNLLCMGEVLGIDLTEAYWEKIEKIKSKYPSEMVNGLSKYEIRKKS